jgi:hypothetical protein
MTITQEDCQLAFEHLSDTEAGACSNGAACAFARRQMTLVTGRHVSSAPRTSRDAAFRLFTRETGC